MKLIVTAMILIACLGSGCMTVQEERDGEPIGSREGLIMVNPAGHLLSDVKSVVEVAYERTVNQKDSSLVTIGFGQDERDGNDTNAIYLLAGGRFYPMGKAPTGFFIHGDVGVGHYDYNLTDNTKYTFMYGINVGYKYLLNAFVFEIGAGYLHVDYKENDGEYLPMARVQAGMTF
jgi:hypothetical protein